MQKKQLITLLAIFVVAVAVAFGVKMMRSSGLEAPSSEVGASLLPDFATNEVTSVVIRKPDGALALDRGEGEDGIWTVRERGGYPADFTKLSDLVGNFSNLTIAQTVAAGPSQFARLQLLPTDDATAGEDDRGTTIEFLDKNGKVLERVLLGREFVRQDGEPSMFGGMRSTPVGRYVKVGDSDAVSIVSETLSEVGTDPTEWLNTDFLKVSNLKSVAISTGKKEDDWRIYREDAAATDWKLAGAKEGEELDSAKIAALKGAFSAPRFDDVAVDVESLGDEAKKFRLLTFDGFEYNIEVGPEVGEDRTHYLTAAVKADLEKERKPEGDETEDEKKERDEAFAETLKGLEERLELDEKLAGHVYVVPNWTVSSLIKTRAELLKTEDEAPGGPGAGGPGGSIPGLQGLEGLPGMPGTPPGGGRLAPLPGSPNGGTPKASAVTPPVGIENGKILSAEEVQKRAVEAAKDAVPSGDTSGDAAKPEKASPKPKAPKGPKAKAEAGDAAAEEKPASEGEAASSGE